LNEENVVEKEEVGISHRSNVQETIIEENSRKEKSRRGWKLLIVMFMMYQMGYA
jgi:hypothetical protein